MENKLFKKISRTGGITIPAQIRHQMNIPKGAAVEIVQTEDNSLLIIFPHACVVELLTM